MALLLSNYDTKMCALRDSLTICTRTDRIISFSPTGNFPQNTLFVIKDQPPTVKNTEYYIQPKSLHKEWHKTDKLHIKNIKSLQLTDICLGKLKFYLHPVFHKLLKHDQVLQPKMAANGHAWELLIGDWKFPGGVCMAHPKNSRQVQL